MFSKMLENKMNIKYVIFLIFLLCAIILYISPKFFIAVPKSIELGNLINKRIFSISLPLGEGFEPWIAVENCKPFEINFQIFDESNEKIYDANITNHSKQLRRLGDILKKYKNHHFCKYLIVQDDKKKWKLFHYNKKYIIKINAIKFPKNLNIYLNLDYLSKWFPNDT